MNIAIDSGMVDADYVIKNEGMYRVYYAVGPSTGAYLLCIDKIVFYSSRFDTEVGFTRFIKHDGSFLNKTYVFKRVAASIEL